MRLRVAAVRELRHPKTSDLLDKGLALRFDAPASSTGEDVVEFHCHGGRRQFVPENADLVSHRDSRAQAQEWDRAGA